MHRFGCSQRQTCAVLKLARSAYLYRSEARDATALKMRIKEITRRACTTVTAACT